MCVCKREYIYYIIFIIDTFIYYDTSLAAQGFWGYRLLIHRYRKNQIPCSATDLGGIGIYAHLRYGLRRTEGRISVRIPAELTERALNAFGR
jgi:hypothetical protein